MSLRGFPEWTSAGWEEVCVCVSDIITIRFSVKPSCFSRCSFNFWFVSHFFIISLPLSEQFFEGLQTSGDLPCKLLAMHTRQ